MFVLPYLIFGLKAFLEVTCTSRPIAALALSAVRHFPLLSIFLTIFIFLVFFRYAVRMDITITFAFVAFNGLLSSAQNIPSGQPEAFPRQQDPGFPFPQNNPNFNPNYQDPTWGGSNSLNPNQDLNNPFAPGGSSNWPTSPNIPPWEQNFLGYEHSVIIRDA